jgi:GNAT superfamily N-acetyltransferase
MKTPLIQLLPQADSRVAGLYEYPGSTFDYLIQTQEPVIGVYIQEQGKVLGWACFSIADSRILEFEEKGEPRLVIGAFVRPEYRHKGLGEKLVKALLQQYHNLSHLPDECLATFQQAQKRPCLFDPAIKNLISSSSLTFEPLCYPHEQDPSEVPIPATRNAPDFD